MPDSNMIYMIVIGVLVAAALIYYLNSRGSKTVAPVGSPSADTQSSSLRLQAYERLTLLVDRIAIPNLVSRTSHEGLTAKEMQLVLTRTIRDEFDYNITQQIYITPEVWNAVKNLKEKNLLLINHVASLLPAEASGLDLNRSLLELLMNDPKADLHELVGQALSFEAKKWL